MKEELNTFIEFALKEDVRDGDHSSLACIPQKASGKAKLLVKENGILAGMEVAFLIRYYVGVTSQLFIATTLSLFEASSKLEIYCFNSLSVFHAVPYIL